MKRRCFWKSEALTSEKFFDLCRFFGAEYVGMAAESIRCR